MLFLAGSSTDVSEDWEKDFDLDMTEEEVQMALSKAEATAEVLLLEPLTPHRSSIPLLFLFIRQWHKIFVYHFIAR